MHELDPSCQPLYAIQTTDIQWTAWQCRGSKVSVQGQGVAAGRELLFLAAGSLTWSHSRLDLSRVNPMRRYDCRAILRFRTLLNLLDAVKMESLFRLPLK
jgi:hypothetical protein